MRLAEKSILLIIYRVLSKGITVIRSILFVRLFVEEIYGSFRQLTMTGDLLSAVFLMALPSSQMYFIPFFICNDEKRKFASQTITILFLSGLLCCLGMIVWSKEIANLFHNTFLISLLRLYAIYMLFKITSEFFTQLMYAHGNVKCAIIANLCFSILQLTTIVAAYIFKFTIIKYLIFLNMVNIGQFVTSILLSRNYIWKTLFYINTNLLKKQYTYTIPLTIKGIVDRFGRQMSSLIVSIFTNPSLFAIFSIGITDIPIYSILSKSVSPVVFPEYARLYRDKKRNEILNLYHEVIRKQILFIIPSFIFLLFLSYPFIITLFTIKYIKSVSIFRVHLCLLPLKSIDLDSLLTASGKAHLIMYGGIIYFLVNCSLSILLITAFGVIGPVIANVSAFLVLMTYYLFHLSRIFKISVNELIPYRVIFSYLIHSLVAILPALIVNYWIKNALLKLVVAGIIFMSLCPLVFKKAGLLTNDDIKLIRKFTGLEILRKKIGGKNGRFNIETT